MKRIECIGKTVIDEWGERLHTSKPPMDIYLPKGFIRDVQVNTKFKVIIEEISTDLKDFTHKEKGQ